jgi:hypothetical protein
VDFLRQQGLDAFGLDRLAPQRPGYFRSNWFEFDYSRQHWGTLIAHQSLSTHFIHSHLHASPDALRYTSLFTNLLATLQLGGALFYAPGIPFFEAGLLKNANCHIERKAIALNDVLGIGEILYSTRIFRV